jgi:hypothetical protein
VQHLVPGVTLSVEMPTQRPRHAITETDEVARALDDAARRWPEDRDARGRLLLRLLHAGHEAIGTNREAEAADRRQAIARTSGALTGAYDEGYLSDLRDDWPA